MGFQLLCCFCTRTEEVRIAPLLALTFYPRPHESVCGHVRPSQGLLLQALALHPFGSAAFCEASLAPNLGPLLSLRRLASSELGRPSLCGHRKSASPHSCDIGTPVLPSGETLRMHNQATYTDGNRLCSQIADRHFATSHLLLQTALCMRAGARRSPLPFKTTLQPG